MEPLRKSLEQYFEMGSHLLAEMAGQWQRHTNRRTVLTLIFAGVITTTAYITVIQAPDDFPVAALVTIPTGASLSEASRSFEELGVVRSAFFLKLIMRISGHQRDVHAGDYLFRQPEDIFTVARAIARGYYGLEPSPIRIPEGATVKQMAIIFDRSLLRFNAAIFLSKASSQEGYLFPDTYNFPPNTDESVVIDSLRQNFDDKIAALQPNIASSSHSLADIVTMASILEREAYNSKDRRMIAGVLWNRLERGMPLQVDVTFAYTLGKGTFQLTMKDLTTPSPYNTYINKGLPPTPIGSPSLDSLLAAVTPTKSDYLYFLADNNHVTHYAKTYEEHLRNKRKYLGS